MNLLGDMLGGHDPSLGPFLGGTDPLGSHDSPWGHAWGSQSPLEDMILLGWRAYRAQCPWGIQGLNAPDVLGGTWYPLGDMLAGHSPLKGHDSSLGRHNPTWKHPWGVPFWGHPWERGHDLPWEGVWVWGPGKESPFPSLTPPPPKVGCDIFVLGEKDQAIISTAEIFIGVLFLFPPFEGQRGVAFWGDPKHEKAASPFWCSGNAHRLPMGGQEKVVTPARVLWDVAKVDCGLVEGGTWFPLWG